MRGKHIIQLDLYVVSMVNLEFFVVIIRRCLVITRKTSPFHNQFSSIVQHEY